MKRRSNLPMLIVEAVRRRITKMATVNTNKNEKEKLKINYINESDRIRCILNPHLLIDESNKIRCPLTPYPLTENKEWFSVRGSPIDPDIDIDERLS